MLLITALTTIVASAATPLKPDHYWPFESTASPAFAVRGSATEVEGVSQNCLRFDGNSLVVVNDSDALTERDDGFTFSIWVNPYAIGQDQQIIAAKNRYSLDQRQWGVMVDRDGLFRLYLWQGRWLTAGAASPPKPGHWYQLGVVVRPSEAELWVNGRRAGTVPLSKPIPKTAAPLTFGGVDDNGHIFQTLLGAIDEARLFDRPLPAEEMAKLYTPVELTHEVPERPQPVVLWKEGSRLPTATEISELSDVEFHVIKKWNKSNDGYTFLHGVGLAWHKGKLYASIGHNKGAENTVTEEAQYRVSEDGGKNWGPLQVIDAGEEDNLAISHGVFLSCQGTLWAFHGAYYNKMERIHTRAYTLDEETSQWHEHGPVVENGFWAMNQPAKMADGNWIMPGGSFGPYSSNGTFPAAVAITHGDDLLKWDFVKIPVGAGVSRMWGESSVIVDGKRVLNIARYGGKAIALAAISDDYGRTWTPSQISNLPMATSKPAAGVLSTGQHYLVCTTARDNGGRRTPLTIAVSQPGERHFSKVFVIRRALHPDHPGESAEHLSLAYPCAVEYEGKLYVGYSNNGGRRGNLNSAELAVIPVDTLSISEGP